MTDLPAPAAAMVTLLRRLDLNERVDIAASPAGISMTAAGVSSLFFPTLDAAAYDLAASLLRRWGPITCMTCRRHVTVNRHLAQRDNLCLWTRTDRTWTRDCQQGDR